MADDAARREIGETQEPRVVAARDLLRYSGVNPSKREELLPGSPEGGAVDGGEAGFDHDGSPSCVVGERY
jgi:hypothetical protein